MPYGMPKEMGGDSPENIKWMEACITKVKKSGKDEGNAIAICKSTFMKMKGNKTKAELIIDTLIASFIERNRSD
jgi:hypothetical protein